MSNKNNLSMLEHPKYDFYECYALELLVELFPERYDGLCIIDKPDLQGNIIGVEVTIARDKDSIEVEKAWIRAFSCNDFQKKEKNIERMKQLGTPYTGGIQSWPKYDCSNKYVFDAINKKISKIKAEEYEEFEIYELFVFSDSNVGEIKRLDNRSEIIEGNVFEYYKKVFIFEKGYMLHIFEKNAHNNIELDDDVLTKVVQRARKRSLGQ